MKEFLVGTCKMPENITDLFVSLDTSLKDVIFCMNKTKRGVALVVDDDKQLIDVITDGDVRRALLAELDLSVPAQMVLDKKEVKNKPITALSSASQKELMRLFQETKISHIPLVDKQNKVVDLVVLDDMVAPGMDFEAVVMAGGAGSRLQPLTKAMPKPMLPVGDRPIMERIITQLSQSGVRRVYVTTHYLEEKIMQHFGDGRDFNIDLQYVSESDQRGTAGGLALMEKQNAPLLVINGDILTGLDFRAMLNFHKQNQATLTVAVRQYEFEVPYGVIEKEGIHIKAIVEKPTKKYFVNAGVYLLEPEAQKLIPKDRHFNMTDLIALLIKKDRSVLSFPVWEYWRDIGHHADYEQVQEDARNGKFEQVSQEME